MPHADWEGEPPGEPRLGRSLALPQSPVERTTTWERSIGVKLNFWQWLAVALLVIGGAWWAYDSFYKTNPAPAAPATPPATQTAAQ